MFLRNHARRLISISTPMTPNLGLVGGKKQVVGYTPGKKFHLKPGDPGDALEIPDEIIASNKVIQAWIRNGDLKDAERPGMEIENLRNLLAEAGIEEPAKTATEVDTNATGITEDDLADMSKEELKVFAESLNMKVNGTWGVERLREEILKHSNGE